MFAPSLIRIIILMVVMQSCLVYNKQPILPTDQLESRIENDKFQPDKINYIVKLKNGDELKYSRVLKIESDTIFFLPKRVIDQRRNNTVKPQPVPINQILQIRERNITASTIYSVSSVALSVILFLLIFAPLGQLP